MSGPQLILIFFSLYFSSPDLLTALKVTRVSPSLIISHRPITLHSPCPVQAPLILQASAEMSLSQTSYLTTALQAHSYPRYMLFLLFIMDISASITGWNNSSKWIFFFFSFFGFIILFIYLFIYFCFFFFLICREFCHTLKWNVLEFTCLPHPDPPSHLLLHPLPPGLPRAPGPSACLMHPTWAGDLFHPW